MFDVVESYTDPKILLAISLAQVENRISNEKFLIEGLFSIDEALKSNVNISYILTCDKDYKEKLFKYRKYKIDAFFVSEGVLHKISETASSSRYIAVADTPYVPPANISIIIILHDIFNAEYTGKIIKIADKFGINFVVCTSKTCDIYDKMTIESSNRKIFKTAFKTFTSLESTLNFLIRDEYKILGYNIKTRIKDGIPEILNTDQIAVLFSGNNDIFSNPDIKDEILNLSESSTFTDDIEQTLYNLFEEISINIRKSVSKELATAGFLIHEVLDIEFNKVSPLTTRHIFFLMILKYDINHDIEKLTASLGIEKDNVQEFIKPLESVGFIKNHRSGCELTQKGEDNLHKLWKSFEKIEDNIFGNFSNIPKVNLIDELKLLQSNCLNIISHEKKDEN